MGAVIGEVVPFGLAVANSGMHLLAVILMLLAPPGHRRRSRSWPAREVAELTDQAWISLLLVADGGRAEIQHEALPAQALAQNPIVELIRAQAVPTHSDV